jgi:hypothetical protein
VCEGVLGAALVAAVARVVAEDVEGVGAGLDEGDGVIKRLQLPHSYICVGCRCRG